jgi:hypothetical protein
MINLRGGMPAITPLDEFKAQVLRDIELCRSYVAADLANRNPPIKDADHVDDVLVSLLTRQDDLRDSIAALVDAGEENTAAARVRGDLIELELEDPLLFDAHSPFPEYLVALELAFRLGGDANSIRAQSHYAQESVRRRRIYQIKTAMIEQDREDEIVAWSVDFSPDRVAAFNVTHG